MSRLLIRLSLILPTLCLVCLVAAQATQPDSPPVPLVEKPRLLELPAEYQLIAGQSAHHFAFSPDSRLLVFADSKNRLIVWDIQTWKESKHLPPGSAICPGSLCFSGDGKVLAVATEKEQLQLLETGTWRVIKEIDIRKDTHTDWAALRLSHDGNLVTAITRDSQVWLWNVKKDTRELLKGHKTRLRDCAVSPDGRLVVTCSGEEGSLRRPSSYPAELKFWDAELGKEIFSGSGTQGMMYELNFSPDSKLIALHGDDRTVRVWDVILRRELFTLKNKERDNSLRGATFSPDGKWIFTVGFFDSEVQAWDASTGRLVKTVPGPIRIATSAAFSPDCRMALVTSNADTKKRLLMLTVPEK
jgi:dipeptidyl aminopeptidase/acylaminoacyl peptidase